MPCYGDQKQSGASTYVSILCPDYFSNAEWTANQRGFPFELHRQQWVRARTARVLRRDADFEATWTLRETRAGLDKEKLGERIVFLTTASCRQYRGEFFERFQIFAKTDLMFWEVVPNHRYTVV